VSVTTAPLAPKASNNENLQRAWRVAAPAILDLGFDHIEAEQPGAGHSATNHP